MILGTSGVDAMELVPVQYRLTKEAADLVNANATERKRGEFVSRAIIEYCRMLQSDRDALAEQECGVFEQINAKLDRIARRTAIILDTLAEQQKQ